jgi:hypothetical protein
MCLERAQAALSVRCELDLLALYTERLMPFASEGGNMVAIAYASGDAIVDLQVDDEGINSKDDDGQVEICWRAHNGLVVWLNAQDGTLDGLDAELNALVECTDYLAERDRSDLLHDEAEDHASKREYRQIAVALRCLYGRKLKTGRASRKAKRFRNR